MKASRYGAVGPLIALTSGPPPVTTLTDLHHVAPTTGGTAGFLNGVNALHFLRTSPIIARSSSRGLPSNIGQFTMWQQVDSSVIAIRLYMLSNIVGPGDTPYDGATGSVEVVVHDNNGVETARETVFTFNVRHRNWLTSSIAPGYSFIAESARVAAVDSAAVARVHAADGVLDSVRIRASFPRR